MFLVLMIIFMRKTKKLLHTLYFQIFYSSLLGTLLLLTFLGVLALYVTTTSLQRHCDLKVKKRSLFDIYE